MEVDCSDGAYKSLQTVAVLFFGIYPIGVYETSKSSCTFGPDISHCDQGVKMAFRFSNVCLKEIACANPNAGVPVITMCVFWK